MDNQSSNQGLLCCRACLVTSCRLYNIHENKLADAFSRISGTPVLKDTLPQYLCSYCCCLLLKCASFRATCLETQKRLILLLNGELNTDCILKLDRPSHRLNLTLSVVNVLEFVETPTTEIKQEPNDVINTAVKCEENIDTNGSLRETSIDNDNLGVSSIDVDNLGVSGSGIDEVNGREPHIDNEDIDTVYVHSNKQNADSIKKRVTKNNEVKSYDNIDDYEENRLFVNKVKTVKTYQKKNGITAKKKLIEIQGHSDKVKGKIGENEDFSLGETRVDVNTHESRLDEINLTETSINDTNLSEPHIDDSNLSEPHIDDIDLSEPHIDDSNLSQPHIDVIDLSEPHIDDSNLSQPHIDDSNLSQPHIDDINLNEPHIDYMNLSEPHIDDSNLSEPDVHDINLNETHIDDSNLIEPHIDDTNLNEPHIDDSNLNEPHIDDIDLSEPHIDVNKITEPNIDEPHVDVIHLSEPQIDDIYLSDSDIDEPLIDVVNLSEPHIDDINLNEPLIDDLHLSEPYIDVITISELHINDINLSKSHIDDAHIEIVDVHKIKKKAALKKQLVNKKVTKHIVKSKDDIDNDEEDTCVLNKVKTIKTYSRKIGTATKKNMMEIQGYSDKVNDTIDKDDAVIDLNEPDLDKIKRKINVRYTNPDLAEDESDIEDINKIEVRVRVKIVKIESIIKKAVKKPKTTVKKQKSDNAVKPMKEQKPIFKQKKSDNAVMPVKRGRTRKKKRRFRNAENDFLPVFDFSEIEKKFDVKIVTLSKQEQLEEIALRKQSYNYTASPYKCEDCGRGFDIDVTYNNHRRKHSPMAGPEACSICSLRYKLPCKRYQHEDIHRLKFICQQCGEVTRTRCQAKSHHDLHNGKRFICKHCDKRFGKRSSCLSHVRLAHPALNVVCEACGETFVSDNGLKMHKKLTHSETKQQFKCTTCSAGFVSLDALNRHTDLGEHAGSPCEQCGESCASEDALRAHVGERHPSESHFCEECCAVFSSRTAFDVHYRRKHLNERAAPPPRARRRPAPALPAPRPRGQFMCEQCGNIASSKASLRYHQNTHLAVKPFPCPHCPKAFPNKSALKWHIRRHTGEKPYKCPECPMTFNLQGNWKRHHQVVHLRVHAAATPCHICARVFTTKSSMRLHVNSVHNGQPWPRRNRRKRKRVSSSSSSSSS